MTKILMMATLVLGMGGVATEGAYAKGSNLGLPADLFESNGVSSTKSKKKVKEASSTNERKSSKRKKK